MSPKEKAAMKKWYTKLAVKLRIIVAQRCVDEGEENNFEDFVKSYFKLNCREHLSKTGRQMWKKKMHFWENQDATTMDIYICEGSASLTTKR